MENSQSILPRNIGAIYFAKKSSSQSGACLATTAQELDYVAPIYELQSKQYFLFIIFY